MDNHSKMICAAILTAGIISNTERTSESYAATKFWKVVEALENEEPNSRYEVDLKNEG